MEKEDIFNNSVILVTGGTGSFGNTFIPMTLAHYKPKKIIVYSRDEMKQWDMALKYAYFADTMPRVSEQTVPLSMELI